jgi:hypothetical protein
MTPTDWKKSGALRAAWAQFKLNPAFAAGIAVARHLNRPSLIVGEDTHVTASRHAFQAGFEAALRAVERLDSLQTNTTQAEVLPEWDHVQSAPTPIE